MSFDAKLFFRRVFECPQGTGIGPEKRTKEISKTSRFADDGIGQIVCVWHEAANIARTLILVQWVVGIVVLSLLQVSQIRKRDTRQASSHKCKAGIQ